MCKDNSHKPKVSNPNVTIEKNGRTNTPPPKVVVTPKKK